MKSLSTSYNLLSTLKNWIFPILVAFALFLVVRPVLAQSLGASNITSIGMESVEGYTQVYYMDKEVKHTITSGNMNSKMPATKGNFITYVTEINGEGQIFLFDGVSGTTTQLTFVSTNLNPKVDEKGRVVWEKWDGETWQISFFDGKSTIQLTTGDTSLNPELSGDYINYGRRDITNTWRAVIYSISENKSIDITTGEKARKTIIRDGKIYLGAGEVGEEEFPLKVSDLFILNLASLESSQSGDLITKELDASPSGVMEIQVDSR